MIKKIKKTLFFLLIFPFFSLMAANYGPNSISPQGVHFVKGHYAEADGTLKIDGPLPFQLIREFGGTEPQLGGWKLHPSSTTEGDPRQKKGGLHLRENEQGVEVVNTAEDHVYGFIRWSLSPDKKKGEITTSEGKYFSLEFDQKGLLKKLERSPTSWVTYQYIRHPLTGDPLISRKNEENNSYLINEYYVLGENFVGGQSVIIESPSDFRIGRVRQQKAPAGEYGFQTIVARYFYSPKSTLYLDALGHATLYNFNDDLINSITYADGSFDHVDPSERLTNIQKRERFFWDEQQRLTCHTIENDHEEIIYCETFLYDSQNHLIKKTVWGDLSGQQHTPLVIDKKGLPLHNGAENTSTQYIYHENNHQLLEEIEDDGNRTLYSYNEQGMIATKRLFHKNQPLLRSAYSYNEDGILTALAIDDGSGEDPNDLRNVTERHQTIITLTGKDHLIPGLPKIIEESHLDIATGAVVTTKTTINTYDSRGHVVQKETCDKDGSCRKVLEASYDRLGRIVYHQDEEHKETVFSYGKGTITAIDLNSATEIVSILDPMGRSSRKIYTDKTGLSKITREEFDPLGRRTATFDLANNPTRFTHDSFGNVIAMEQPSIEGENGEKIIPKTLYTYDALGRMTSTVDANGWETTMRYSALGKPIEIRYPDGTQETFTYSLNGRLLSSTAKNGMKTLYRYDPLGHAIETSLYSNNGTLLSTKSDTYNSLHHLSQIDPNGFTTHFSYDGAGRMNSIEKEMEEGISKEHFIYDAMGKVMESHLWHGLDEQEKSIIRVERDHQQQWISTSLYDSENNLVRFQTPESPTQEPISPDISSDASDAFGQKITEAIYVDAAGNKKIITYNALMKISTTQNLSPFGQLLAKTTYFYDAAGNKVRQISTAGDSLEQKEWHYGPGNRVEKIITSSVETVQTTHYTYNSSGQLEQIIKSDGTSLIHKYDGKGRLSHFYASDQTISYLYHYDAKDQIVRVEDLHHNTITSRSYTALGNISEETLGNGLSLKNSYDLRGRRTQIDLHDHSCIHYEYDAAGIISIARYSPKGIQQYLHRYTDFDSSGRPVAEEMIGSAGTMTTSYDKSSRIVAIDTPYWSESIPPESFDDRGNIQFITTNDLNGSKTAYYSYDALNQLIEEEGEASHQYVYDSFGNRLSKDGEPQKIEAYHRVIKEGQVANYAYDANGSIIAEVLSTKTKHFSYDALGRLISAEDDILSTTYTYDSYHRRLSKTQKRWDEKAAQWGKPTTLRFLFDEDREIGAVDEEGNLIELRVLGEKHGAEIGAAIALEIDGKTYAPIHDHRGSLHSLIDIETHQIAETYLQTAFGEETIYSSTGKIIAPYSCISPWRYNSKRFDPETGWIYFGKRYYDPQLGRWTTADPLGDFDGPNPHLFLKNNPLIHNDLYGLFSVTAFFYPFFKKVSRGITALNDFRTTYIAPWFEGDRLGNVEKFTGNVLQTFVGKSLYWLSGNEIDTAFAGLYGEGEIDPKVRITFINGILSPKDAHEKNLKTISEAHNGNNVHYVYRGTYGWTVDVMQAIAVRFGYISNEAQQLSHLWKSMINEMGGIREGGLIIHYAHSLGGAETLAAKHMLNKEETKMIRVITFGSPLIFFDEDFESVIHYVNVRDGISILFDPVRFVKAMMYREKHVIFIGNWQGIPLVEHLLQDYWQHLKDILHNQFEDLISA